MNKLQNNKYDLEEKTTVFAENIIDYIKEVKRDRLNEPILIQLIRSASSVGANYCEAIGASSRKDFRNKIYICKKEVQETKYWLRMMARMHPESKDRLRKFWVEAQDLTLIFTKIVSTINKNDIG